jgi:holo-[acyl-carrier protein] synthase
MVVGLGVDLVEWARVSQSLERWGDRFVAKLMDPEEALHLPPPGEAQAKALALAVAGKEAMSKALGTGWSGGVRWRDVVVELGPPPVARLLGRAALVARARGSSGRSRLALELQGPLAIGEAWLLS